LSRVVRLVFGVVFVIGCVVLLNCCGIESSSVEINTFIKHWMTNEASEMEKKAL